MKHIVLAVFATAAGSSPAAASNDKNAEALESFLSSLACRTAVISTGQHLSGAVNFWTPTNKHPFAVFTIAPDAASAERHSRLKIFSPFNGHYLARLNGGSRSISTRIFWSRDDDLVVWDSQRLWWLQGDAVRSGGRIGFKQTPVPRNVHPEMWGADQAVPEHFAETARSAGPNYNDIVEFDPRSGQFSDTGVLVGPNMGVGWTPRGRIIRIAWDGERKHLEALEPDLQTWREFAPLSFAGDARLLLVRDAPETLETEAIVTWRDESGLGQIGIVRRGASKARVIARGRVEHVPATPDRSKLYGYVDQVGRFHRIESETHAPNVEFWLRKLEAIEGVEDFRLFGDARYAVIKASDGTAGPEIAVLERQGGVARAIGTLCQTRSPVRSTVSRDGAILFQPIKTAGNVLIVYLKGGPSGYVSRAGNYNIDLLTAEGLPVLAVNYTGSLDGTGRIRSPQRLSETYGLEVQQAIAFARSIPGMSDRQIVLIGASFGSVVGFSALLTGRVDAAGFLVVAGLTKPERMLEFPAREVAFASYAFQLRIARETGPFNVTELAKAHPDLRLGFIHGERDRRAPLPDIADFVRRYNELKPRAPAELTTIAGMGHSASTRTEHREYIDAVRQYLQALTRAP